MGRRCDIEPSAQQTYVDAALAAVLQGELQQLLEPRTPGASWPGAPSVPHENGYHGRLGACRRLRKLAQNFPAPFGVIGGLCLGDKDLEDDDIKRQQRSNIHVLFHRCDACELQPGEPHLLHSGDD